MTRAYYSASISSFLSSKQEEILGELLRNDEFSTTDLQKRAWEQEIEILRDQLKNIGEGEIALEYTIPRMGRRIDAVCIIKGIIFVIEFKVFDEAHRKTTDDQVIDYALDLKYFHEQSKDRFIVPISVPTEAASEPINIQFTDDRVAEVIHGNKSDLNDILGQVLAVRSDSPLAMNDWINSRYAPTPTIIEAAQAMYRNHTVQDISRTDAGANNLSETTKEIGEIIEKCKAGHRKAICFVTGVPGAGKTLAGLNIANSRHEFEKDEHAVFLSGNQPLVDVLQEALTRDECRRRKEAGEKITKGEASRKTQSFIQLIHRFRDEALSSAKPPVEKVAIFDEAQRAWNCAQLSKFMENKKGIPGFNQSEPDFLIGYMDRHQDWATIICLVGGGQDINTGEAGIGEWFDVLRTKYPNWDIFLSDKMTGSEYLGSSSVSELLDGRVFQTKSALHLAVSLRSFRSEKLSSFAKALLDNDPASASAIYPELSVHYPIFVTRDFNAAKKWVRTKARGTERYGLLASSKGKRLRAEGIWVLQEINHVSWFLDEKGVVDSSFSLEVAASEFKVQGLEVDYAVLAWDIDFRYKDGSFQNFQFKGGDNWKKIDKEENKNYQKNAYRVLLTRARQGLVIYVPKGEDPAKDPSRDSASYDATYDYLRSCGIQELTAP
jgi:hypothetical protein